MSVADKLTASRMVLSPIFFIIFMWGSRLGLSAHILVPLLWLIFGLIEISDLFDGMAARKQGNVSSFGKLFDPFADVFARLSYFLCFVSANIMPVWIFLVIMYREFSQLFLRQLAAEKGVAMAARKGGKAKAVFYMISGLGSMIFWSMNSLNIFSELQKTVKGVVLGIYIIALLLSLASFVDYIIQFRKISLSVEK